MNAAAAKHHFLRNLTNPDPCRPFLYARSMGRAASRNAAGKRRRPEVGAFISGRAATVTIRPRDIKVALGAQFVLDRASGSGPHGKGKLRSHRAERQGVRRALRDDDYS